jgi:Fe-S-cluster containining protein
MTTGTAMDKSRRRNREPSSASDAAVVREELAAIYAEVEALAPPRDCRLTTTCCRFAETGREPWATEPELAYLRWWLRRQGRDTLAPREDGNCPLLGVDGRCSAYEARPFGCRTHFCRAAGGPLGARLLREPLQRLAALDESVTGTNSSGPLRRALAAWSSPSRRATNTRRGR